MPSPVPVNAIVAAKLLLVDGHRAGRKARCMVLQEAGYHAVGVSQPEEALQLLRTETFQLVITEFKLTGTTGTDFISAIRAVAGAVPVLLLSGWVDPLGLNERSTGADAVLMKSASEPKQLILAVKRLLRLHAHARPYSARSAAKARKKPAASADPAAQPALLRRAGSGA